VSAIPPPASGGAVAAPRAPDPARRSRAHSAGGHARAAFALLAMTLFVSAFAYPLFVTGVAQLIDPSAANGSLVDYPNGTVAGSTLVAQNTDTPYLFWERPSLTDYNTTLGADTPPGPSDPALGALLNETIAYMQKYGTYTVNASLPFWLVAPSASDIDPDLTPEAVLVQVIRVSDNTNLSVAWLTGFVNDHIVNPPVPDLGVPYVDVLQLDLDLLPYTGR
jgi:potassium-transporting ATPase KdpC subunit